MKTNIRWLSLLLVVLCLLAGCSHGEAAYSDNSQAGDSVYADLISIEPWTKTGVTNDGGLTVEYTKVLCEGCTTKGEQVWIYLDIDEYQAQFDDTADFSGDSWWAARLNYTDPVRIHGTMAESGDLKQETGRDLILVFSARD